MTKIYKGRQGWRSAGFNITAISNFLSLAVVAGLGIGLINNAPVGGSPTAPTFNVVGSLLVCGVVFLIWVGSLFGLAYLMRNQPQAVTIEADRVLVEGAPGTVIEIPISAILYVNTTQVPVKYLGYKASYRGLLIRYQNTANGQKQECIISERNTTNFEDLSERLRALAPKSEYVRRKTV